MYLIYSVDVTVLGKLTDFYILWHYRYIICDFSFFNFINICVFPIVNNFMVMVFNATFNSISVITWLNN
jgi:hypothetical protein